ncbi:MAG: sporulation protein YqfD [Peptococcaceae bacterium]|nr:sporulation protein YqfD [Peptococcaceae bacterium]
MKHSHQKNFYHWANGSVVIYIRGNGIEKFLNLVMQEQIEIREICWQNEELVTAKVPWYSLGKLRHLARRSKCHFRVYRKSGLPLFILKMKRRQALVIGTFLFAVVVYMASFIPLQVEVESPEPLTTVRFEEIISLADEKGIQPYRSTWFMDFHEAEEYILRQQSALSWVGIRSERGKIIISVVERKLADQEESDLLFGNILAEKDGMVDHILVRRGTAAVEKGSTVIAGQPLVWGNNGQQRLAADAIIQARVWYQGFGECSRIETSSLLTGEEEISVALRRGQGKSLLLWGKKEAPYELCHEEEQVYPLTIWGRWQLPVSGVITSYAQEEAVTTERSSEEALAEAIARGKMEAQKKVPAAAEVLNEHVRIIAKGPDLFQVQVTLEVREDIGVFVPLAPEDQVQLELLPETEEDGENGADVAPVE